MGANTISWRRVKQINARTGERFVHGVTWSHNAHWLWLMVRHDGTAVVYDKRRQALDADYVDPVPTSTMRLLATRESIPGLLTPNDYEWLAELDDRAREIGVLQD